MEKGKVEGKHEANTETAQRLLAMGMDEASVMDMTGLTAEEIKLLKAEM